jgi:hypothetical protein
MRLPGALAREQRLKLEQQRQQTQALPPGAGTGIAGAGTGIAGAGTAGGVGAGGVGAGGVGTVGVGAGAVPGRPASMTIEVHHTL